MTEHGIHLEAENRFLSSILLPGCAWIIAPPSRQQTGVHDQFLTRDHTQTDQLGRQGEEEEKKRQDPQGRAALPIVALRNGAAFKAQGDGQFSVGSYVIHDLFVRLAPHSLHDGHHQDAAVPIPCRSPACSPFQTWRLKVSRTMKLIHLPQRYSRSVDR